MNPQQEYEYWTTPERVKERFVKYNDSSDLLISYKKDGGPNSYNPRYNRIAWRDGHSSGHRDEKDGPAIIKSGEWYSYYKDGMPHRLGGPAIVSLDDAMVYYRIHGEVIETPAQYQQASGMSDEEMSIMLMKYGWAST